MAGCRACCETELTISADVLRDVHTREYAYVIQNLLCCQVASVLVSVCLDSARLQSS